MGEVKTEVTFKDFPYICRVCLSRKRLRSFDHSNSVLQLFEEITNIHVHRESDLPRNICEVCVNQLENISSFISLSKTTDDTLKEVLKKNMLTCSEEIGLDSDLTDSNQCFDESDEIKIERAVTADNLECETVSESNQENIEDKKPLTRSIKSQSTSCYVCGENFGTKRKLIKHWSKNVICAVKEFKCVHCEKAFMTKFKLKTHMRCHTKETPFQCNICSKKFRQSSNLKRHDDTVHKGLRPFKCEICGKEFATYLRKTEHFYIHTGERPYMCAYCGKSFKKYSNRYAHEMRHKIKNGEIIKNNLKPKKYPRKKPENPAELKCNICDKILSSKQALGVHIQIHIGEKSFLCNVCGKGFLRKSHLEVHVRIHTEERPYKCSSCGKLFRFASGYRNHLRSHKGERSYKCDVCQRTFIQLAHLKSHTKTHTGEKPYKCTFCGKGFAQNGNLKAHTRIHTGERPYQCCVCCMGFYDSTSMKKHKKSHGNIEETENKFIDSQLSVK